MEKLFDLIVLVLTFSLLLCSCGEGQEKQVYCEFTDGVGNRVVLEKAPEKVAVLFSSFADIWVSAGGSVSVTVGEAVERGFADENTVLVDEGAGKTVNTELLLAAEPDLVIYSADIEAQVKCAELLSDADIPAAGFRVETVGDYLEALDILTDITGRKDLYEKNGAEVKKQVDAVVAEKPFSGKRILFIRAGSSARSVKIKSSEDNFAAAMITDLGAVNIADESPSMVDNLSLEAVLQSDPDYIFFTAMGDEEASKQYVYELLKGDGWSSLEAVEKGNYCYLPKQLFHYKPNSRWGEAYSYLKNLM